MRYLLALSAIVTSGCVELQPDGSACTSDFDCDSRLCLQAGSDGSAGWPEGLCSRHCPEATCGAGMACRRLVSTALCLPACTDTDGCRDGYVCNPDIDVCLPDCRSGWDCGGNLVCDPSDGVCRIPATTTTTTGPSTSLASIGEACTSHVACASGICFSPLDGAPWPDGTCASPCGSSACTDGSACLVLEGVPWCVGGCADRADCRSGYVCSSAWGACVPDCRTGWSCGTGFVCDAADGQCRVSTTAAAVGSPCEGNVDCASGICFEEGVDPGWAGGMCVGLCGTESCGVDTACVALDGVGYCTPRCATTGDCRTGYACSEDPAVCLPDCRLGWSCGDVLRCDPVDGVCRADATSSGPTDENGDPCQTDDVCLSGRCLLQSGFTAGICVQPCSAGCFTTEACVTFAGEQLCLPRCTRNTDCSAYDGSTYVCDFTRRTCTPSCNRGWQCEPTESCSPRGDCE